jgi:hypothetical protein
MKTTTRKRIEPREATQEATVLSLLKRGKRLSNLPVVTRYRICRLSAVIKRLRKKHWPIITLDKRMKDGSLYGEYVLGKA